MIMNHAISFLDFSSRYHTSALTAETAEQWLRSLGYTVTHEDTRPHCGGTAGNLAQLLVACGIVERAAVEDPEGYDNHRTHGQIIELHRRLKGICDV